MEASADGQWTCTPFCGGFAAFSTPLGTAEFPDTLGGALVREAAEGREARYAIPASAAGLRVERRVFVPGEGGFARLLDRVQNATASTLEVSYSTELLAQSGDGDWSIGTTSSGDGQLDAGDGFATLGGSDPSAPELAFVFAGPGARTSVAETGSDLGAGYGHVWQSGSFTLPPGGSAVLLRFVVQGVRGESAAVRSLADSLHRLDAAVRDRALALLGAEERAQLVNFAVPEP